MLESIKVPDDVRNLNLRQLIRLSKDIRERIIDVTSKTGGHLAPSLGVVELTVALLKVFDPLKNRIVWDVGHQSYAYKILTGRNARFDTLRQLGGISGFNNIFESKYDTFGVGHSSTSISAGLGIYVGKELKKKPEKVVVVIGDGAMTAGEAFEGLNNVGGLNKKLIIILNDNSMSISKNVGGMHSYLANILTGKRYNKLKKEVWDAVQSLPRMVRNRIIYGVRRLEDSILSMLIPSSLFEDLGFKYIGPINGHSIPTLIKILSNVKQHVDVPCLIHILTKKGKGFPFAEQDATKFHGVPSFNNLTGELNKTKKDKAIISYSTLFGRTLEKMAEKDERVIAITAAMTDGTGLKGFAERFPERLFDVGIAEQHAVTFAAGLAIEGIKPFVAIYSTFLQRAYDQIIHDVALQKLPVRFVIDRGGLVGEDGPTHHGAFDLSYLRCIPNMTIMAPRDGKELEKMLKFMAGYKKGPIAVRYPRGKIQNFPELTNPRITYGKSEVIFNEGKIAIITIGAVFKIGYEVCNELQSKGILSYLINARFVKPLDSEMLLELATKGVKNIVTIEENVVRAGFGSAVLQKANELGLKFRIKMFGIPDKFITYGKTSQLHHLIGLETKNILDFILREIEE
ncbi:MAG: 1-deoxy-D-xylulose-5-phosphate synthase [Candidatus Cloacimonadota bacterium]|nr:1-deoxy-D-xylulose-5-phosphate synthase [Candidatus Cloacimonadota bacterium]